MMLDGRGEVDKTGAFLAESDCLSTAGTAEMTVPFASRSGVAPTTDIRFWEDKRREPLPSASDGRGRATGVAA